MIKNIWKVIFNAIFCDKFWQEESFLMYDVAIIINKSKK